jgi:hypothetical protein
MKFLTKRGTYLALGAALALAPIPTSAKVVFTEDFDYAAGNLYNSGSWTRYASHTANPIQVGEGSLTFPGYSAQGVGNMAVVENPTDNQDEDLHCPFINDEAIISGNIYMGALVNIKTVPTSTESGCLSHFILCFDGRTKNSAIADGKSTNNYWRLFVRESKNEGKFTFGLGKNKATETVYTTTEYDLNTTYLVVLKYEYVDGSANDALSLYINEVDSTEPATPAISTSTGTDATTTGNSNSSDYGIGGVAIMQNGTSSKPGAEFKIDALKVTTQWSELFDGTDNPDTPETPATAAINPATFDSFGTTVAGYPISKTLNVKATGLTSDITVGAPDNSVFTLSATSIDKDAAMSADGYDLTITFSPTAKGDFSGKFDLTSDGAETVSVNLAGSSLDCTTIPTSTAIINQTAGDGTIFRYTGKATVTYIDAANTTIYAQDMLGGLAVNYSYMTSNDVKVGDQITNIVGYIETAQNVPYLYNILPAVVSSTDNVKLPTEVTLSDILSSPESYIHRLVKVADLTFTAESGATFSTSGIDVTDGTNSGKVLPFAGTDLIGTEIPAQATVTGIVRSLAIASISPRSAADVVAKVDEPTFTVTSTYRYEGEPVAINTPTVVRRYDVAAANLTAEASVYITGTNRGMFDVSPATIAQGTSDSEIVVTYTPTAIGKHTGRVNFDVTPSTLSTGEAFTYYAYDPANPPTITLPTAPETLTAKPGETATAVIAVNTANLVDYGSISVKGDAAGAITINSTTLLKNGTTNITITFKPSAEGEFTETLIFSALKADTAELTITAKCEGEKAEEPTQGDELTLTTENPLTYLNETFSSVTKNQPISLTAWHNTAVTGKRAWWGYEFDDDANKAAKVTAYDSQVASGDETPCQMLLVTPPLDFNGAASKIVTFRVMGDLLLEGQTDNLEVCYMDIADNGNLYTQPLQGLNIPASDDYNGTWQDYVIDFEGQELADVFFIGFRFTSTRGGNNSAIYYIDDVTYGRTDVPQIKLPDAQLETTAACATQHEIAVAVTGKNLTDSISVSLSGDNRDLFTLSTTKLPSSGGDINLTFQADELGEYYAYLVLSSTGAASVSYPIYVKVDNESATPVITLDADGAVNVYNLMGIKVNATDPGRLPAGIYIVNGRKLIVK